MAKLKKSRSEILDRARQLGEEYEQKYGGCCQSTLLAVIDALKEAGLDILPSETREKLYSGICLLSAGTCLTGEGTCGAVAGGTMAIGMAKGIPMDNPSPMQETAVLIQKTLLKKFYEKYGSILCKEIMRKYFGKAWNLWDEEMTEEFLGITDGCVIRETAELTAGIILDEVEKRNIETA
jgi:hypothetical protein